MKEVILATVLSGSIPGVNANSISNEWAFSNCNDFTRDYSVFEATKMGGNGITSLNFSRRTDVTVFSIEFLGSNSITGSIKFEYRLRKGAVKSSDEIPEVWFDAGDRVLISTVGRQGNIVPKLIGLLIEALKKDGKNLFY